MKFGWKGLIGNRLVSAIGMYLVW